ncbi:hypothetical protein RUM44_005506 [Polyplax serrata]|uniref:NADH dehydrogenase [ubiquinone] iron-sulfur protein 4, mitochondrial n=1 Tax=Polyplax serrata TaxID=468196 RepID=A0ABR1ADK7_POLSC
MSVQLIKRRVQLATLKRYTTGFVRPETRSCSNTKALSQNEPLESQKSSLQKTTIDGKITVLGPDDISHISGIPEEHLKERLVRIYRTPKNAMQSGTHNVDHWEMEFETRSRWENPLMGWASTGDPHSNMKVQFLDKESAIHHAEKNGYRWFIDPDKKLMPKAKSYGFNFSWNKRTRVTTK